MNISWELLNLWLQARWTDDTELQAEIEGLVRDSVLPWAYMCPLEAEERTMDFFPPCLLLARLIVTVLPEEEAAAWLEGRVPADWDLEPVTSFASIHRAGLNFSRAWGLWALRDATADPHLGELYLDHVSTHMDMPEYWAEDYYSYAHWVPQFGVYALALTWEEPPFL